MFLHALLWTFCRLIYHWHSIKVILIKSEKILHCQLWEANEAITANLDRDEHIVEHALTTVPIETVNLNSFFFMKLQNLLRGRKTRRRNRTKRTTWKAETTTRNRWTPMTLSTTGCFLQNIQWNRESTWWQPCHEVRVAWHWRTTDDKKEIWRDELYHDAEITLENNGVWWVTSCSMLCK